MTLHHGLSLQDQEKPEQLNICSFRELEFRLGIPREHLRLVAAHAGGYYQPFEKPTRPLPFQKYFSVSKKRKIDNPTISLKDVQKRIQRKLLKPLLFPSYLYGGVKGRTVLDKVNLHFGAKILVKIDIRSFFPNISNFQVYEVWKNLLGCSTKISQLLTKLTTFERHLPQGASTSTSLANLVLFNVDEPIRKECLNRGVRYSAWVDDLAFSGDEAPNVINNSVQALMSAGFAVPHRKMKIMGPGSRKVLNGVLLGKFPSVLPERISRIRSGIHKLSSGEVPPNEIEKYIQSLNGKVNHVMSIVPHKGQRLAKALDIAIHNCSPS